MSDQQDAREQARHIIDTVQGYLDEKPIRVRQKRPRGEWEDINPEEESPSWDWDGFDFEVKPEERKPQSIKLWIHPDGRLPQLEIFFQNAEAAEDFGWKLTTFREVLPSENTGGRDV